MQMNRRTRRCAWLLVLGLQVTLALASCGTLGSGTAAAPSSAGYHQCSAAANNLPACAISDAIIAAGCQNLPAFNEDDGTWEITWRPGTIYNGSPDGVLTMVWLGIGDCSGNPEAPGDLYAFVYSNGSVTGGPNDQESRFGPGIDSTPDVQGVSMVIACTDYLIDIPAPGLLAKGSHTLPTLLTKPNGADCQPG